MTTQEKEIKSTILQNKNRHMEKCYKIYNIYMLSNM